jgi:hypothetical protein
MTSDDDPRPELTRLSERVIAQEIRAYEGLFAEAMAAVSNVPPSSLWVSTMSAPRAMSAQWRR